MENDKTQHVTIYHNGICSKSHGALEILQQKNIPHTIRWYLTDPLSKEELEALLKKLNMQPSELVRTDETVFTEHFDGKEMSEKEWLNVLLENPILLQRPIVEMGNIAIIARPPEKIFEIL